MDIIPNEILMKILINIQKLVSDKQNYKKISKKFYNLVEILIEHYDNKFNNIVKNWKDNPKKLVNELIKEDDLDSITFLLNNYNVLKYVNFYAAYYKRLDLLGKFDNYQEIANGAALGGHLDIVKYAVKKGANNFKDIADYGALGGHLDIVKYAVKKGANNFKDIADYGAESGNLDIVKYAVDKNANNFNDIALRAAFNGHLNIVKYAVDKGADNFNFIALWAARNGHLNIVKYAVDRGANAFNEIAEYAAYGRHLNVIKYALKKGANNFNRILEVSYENKKFLMKLAPLIEQYKNRSS